SAEEAQGTVRLGEVERSHRAVEMAAENGHGAVRDLLRLQLAAQLLRQGRSGSLQPIDAAPFGLEPPEVLGHLVRLPGQVAQLVAADDRDGGAEVTPA